VHRVKQHLARNNNPADGHSRRPDYEIGYERPTARLLATLAAIEPYDYYRLPWESRLPTHWLPTCKRKSSISQWSVSLTWQRKVEWRAQRTSHKDWNVVSGALTDEGRIYCKYGYRSSFQCCNKDYWWPGPAEFFPTNWESSSASALESMVSMTGYRDAYKLDIPMQWLIAMVTGMVMMSCKCKQFRMRYWTTAIWLPNWSGRRWKMITEHTK